MADSYNIDLCIDCVQADANGYDEETMADWPGFVPSWEGWIFGAVTVDGLPVSGYVRPGTDCDGCGRGDGGDRYEYTAVKITDKGGS
jgi:hypothetical protein